MHPLLSVHSVQCYSVTKVKLKRYINAIQGNARNKQTNKHSHVYIAERTQWVLPTSQDVLVYLESGSPTNLLLGLPNSGGDPVYDVYLAAAPSFAIAGLLIGEPLLLTTTTIAHQLILSASAEFYTPVLSSVQIRQLTSTAKNWWC